MSNEFNVFSQIFYFLLIFSVLPLTSLRRSVTTVAIPALEGGAACTGGDTPIFGIATTRKGARNDGLVRQ